MLEKKKLTESTEIELALPENGFSSDFVDALSDICSKHDVLTEGYLVLKKENEDVSLLLGLLFFDNYPLNKQEQDIQNIMQEVTDLFSDEMIVEAISLNNNRQLNRTMKSIGSPFYSIRKP